ncbi:hypothetical protein, partial [Fulvimarina sp. MAC8]|uniref:hypothetical protein n=1 Tax=Fulvimarina sp. MAC8 TaxID=3162874 RepID=UPI0032EB33A3
LLRQQRRDNLPFGIGQFVTAHIQSPFQESESNQATGVNPLMRIRPSGIESHSLSCRAADREACL